MPDLAWIDELPPLLTLQEVARFTRTSTKTIRRRISQGRLPVCRLAHGGSARVLIHRSAFKLMLEQGVL